MSKLKIVRAYPYYPKFLKQFYTDNPQSQYLEFQEHLDLLEQFGFDETQDFLKTMTSLGYEAYSIILNASKLNGTWMHQNGSGSLPYLVQHLKKIRPQIFLYDGHAISGSMLKLIQSEVPSIKLKLATCCGVLNDTYIEWLREADIVITCSKSFVDNFKNLKLKTYFLRHAFPDRFLREPQNVKNKSCIFAGALAVGAGYHNDRIELIASLLAAGVPIKIFAQMNPFWKEMLKEFIYSAKKFIRKNSDQSLSGEGHLGSIPYNVRSHAMPPIYGQKMYDQISSYLVALNIHAGIAGQYTANQRVFEVCGVGTCLLTDLKIDLHEIYELDKEVVAYSDHFECLDKLKWLIENPDVAQRIGRASYSRTKKEHLISHRMHELNDLIQSNLNV